MKAMDRHQKVTGDFIDAGSVVARTEGLLHPTFIDRSEATFTYVGIDQYDHYGDMDKEDKKSYNSHERKHSAPAALSALVAPVPAPAPAPTPAKKPQQLKHKGAARLFTPFFSSLD